MNSIIMMLSKVIGFILKKMGRGSTYPGDFALKLNKNYLRFFKPPKYVMYVTGSNGKSTVTHMLVSTFKASGYRVGHNNAGSNLIEGITTCFIENSNIFGKSKVDIMILEIDERYVKMVLPTINATHFVVTNISRDQPQRQGNFEFVYDEIKRGLNTNAHLFLNINDPICSRFGIDYPGEVTYFGLEKTNGSFNNKLTDNLDAVFCPICEEKLEYKFKHYGGVGSFECKNGHFKNNNKKYISKLIDVDKIEIDGHIIEISQPFFYNLYNATVCYSVAKTFEIETQIIKNSIGNLNFKRNDQMIFDGKELNFVLSKNENSVSYNQSVNYVSNQANKCSVVLGFQNVSRRYPFKDLSWLYDIEFEVLQKGNVVDVICTGKFCYDIAARIKLAGFNPIIAPDYNELFHAIKNTDVNKIYCLFCFEIEKNLKKTIKEHL